MNELKEQDINIGISAEVEQSVNQLNIDDLVKVKQVLTTAPTFVPKRFIDQLQIVLTAGTYYLYIYCQDTTPGTWKKVTIA